jgi:hypothetical protein
VLISRRAIDSVKDCREDNANTSVFLIVCSLAVHTRMGNFERVVGKDYLSENCAVLIVDLLGELQNQDL